MIHLPRFDALLWLMAISLIANGCAQAEKSQLPPTVSVKGTVKIDGLPLANAAVQFHPEGTTAGVGSGGYTDQHGNFELITVSGGSEITKGAPVGKYKVTVSKFMKPDGTDFPLDSKEPPGLTGAVETVPMIYSDPQWTTLDAQVPPAGGVIHLVLNTPR